MTAGQSNRAALLDRIRYDLVTRSGGYLRNTLRIPGVTCAVCTAPVDGYPRCFQCNKWRSVLGLADLVAPLAYGVNLQQSGNMLRHYKDDVSQQVKLKHRSVVQHMLFLGIVHHEQCIAKVVGSPVELRLTVPSLSGRTGTHPFEALATDMHAIADECRLATAQGATAVRTVEGGRFRVVQPGHVSGRHVLLLDDTWTTGSRTNSAALTLRAAGASAVSVLVVGRWLEPTFGKTKDFIRDRLKADYDPMVCPVTGATCPR